MDSIKPLDHLAEILRRRVASEASSRLRDSGGLASDRQSTSLERCSPEALRDQIAQSLKNIDRNDPEYSEKTMGVFVESVLAWQFGSSLLSDPEFQNLVEQTRDAMCREVGVVSAFRKVFGEQL